MADDGWISTVTSTSISQQELEWRLWAAADALRGPADPGDFKDYVFPVLFWKWLSDTHVFERAQPVAGPGAGNY